jgi:transposase-like protein
VTLSTRLRNVDLTLECERCAHLTVKKGSWFMTISTFKCPVCHDKRPLTYSDKVKLFAKHAHLTAQGLQDGPLSGIAEP